MKFHEVKKHPSLMIYPLIVLVTVQIINYFAFLGNVVTLIEIFTYAFMGLYATKNLKMRYTESALSSASVAVVYYSFVELLHFMSGINFSIIPIIYQLAQAIVTTTIVALLTKKYMVAK